MLDHHIHGNSCIFSNSHGRTPYAPLFSFLKACGMRGLGKAQDYYLSYSIYCRQRDVALFLVEDICQKLFRKPGRVQEHSRFVPLGGLERKPINTLRYEGMGVFPFSKILKNDPLERCVQEDILMASP